MRSAKGKRCLHSHGPTAKRKWQNMRVASGDSQCVNVATFALLWLAKHSENTRTHKLRDSRIGVSISRDLCAQQKAIKYLLFHVAWPMISRR